MNPALIFKIMMWLYLGIKSPLVTKFLDNATKGTTTKVDDWLWAGVKDLLGTYEPNEEKLTELLGSVQAKYEADKEAAKQPVQLDFNV